MNVIVDKDKLDGLADAIGIKSKVRLPLTIDEQIEAVNLIETDPKLQDKQVTLTPKAEAQTETVTADDGYDGLGEVAVNVKEAPLTNYNRGNLTSSGSYTFTPSSPYIGYSEVSFNVPTSSQTKAINVGFTTQNNVRKWRARPYTYTTTAGWVNTGYAYGGYTYYDAIPTGTTVTPSTTAQTIGGANVMMEGAVTVSAIQTETKNATPSTSAQDITPTSGKYLTKVTVEAVPSGSLGIPSWNHSKTDSSYHISVSYPNINAGYISSAGVASMNMTLEDKTATPSTSSQTIVPTNDTCYLNSVTVDPIPSEYIIPSGTKQITANGTGIDVTQYAEVDVAVPSSQPNLQNKSVSYTPSETAQSDTVSADAGYDGLDEVSVSVGAISSTYVGSGITRRDSSDLTASGATVSVPSGYYESNESKAVASGSEGTPTATKGAVSNHAITVTPSVTNSAGYISGGTHTGTGVSVAASEVVSGTYNVTSSGTKDVTNYASASVPSMTLPSAASGSSSGTSKATIGRSTSNQYINIPTGYNDTAQYYTVSAVANGTAGTPTATKGTVSNHSISVTPSVTNTTGYITGSTKTGTAVTVSASELVSGSETKTANGTYDVTNLAELVVNVSGGGGTSKNTQIVQGTTRTTSSTMTAIGAELTVSKTGTYDIYWSAFRSTTSTSYTFATQLYINGTAHGSENATWSNHCQNNHLTNISLTQGQKLRVYGRESRNSSYYMYAPMLCIVEN